MDAIWPIVAGEPPTSRITRGMRGETKLIPKARRRTVKRMGSNPLSRLSINLKLKAYCPVLSSHHSDFLPIE
jgi:hypothetical protein